MDRQRVDRKISKCFRERKKILETERGQRISTNNICGPIFVVSEEEKNSESWARDIFKRRGVERKCFYLATTNEDLKTQK